MGEHLCIDKGGFVEKEQGQRGQACVGRRLRDTGIGQHSLTYLPSSVVRDPIVAGPLWVPYVTSLENTTNYRPPVSLLLSISSYC
jgi:hypothetical protein